MTDENLLDKAIETLSDFRDTRITLVQALEEVEAQIEASINVRDEIKAVLVSSEEDVSSITVIKKRSAGKKTLTRRPNSKKTEENNKATTDFDLPEPPSGPEKHASPSIANNEVNLEDEIGTWEPGEDDEEIIPPIPKNEKADKNDLDFDHLEF